MPNLKIKSNLQTQCLDTQKMVIKKLLKITNTLHSTLKKHIKYSINSEKNILWLKYFFKKRPTNLLFSIDQFLLEFLKKMPQTKKYSEYKYQLKERKKLKIFYGSLSNKQFLQTLDQSLNIPGYFYKNLLVLLENRLDVVLYRSNFVQSISQARQLINHKKILVNNFIVASPSYKIIPGDIISVEKNTALKLQKKLKQEIKINNVLLQLSSNKKRAINSKKIDFSTPIKMNKYTTTLAKLILKKMQRDNTVDFFKNPYFIDKNSHFFGLIQHKSLLTKKSQAKFSNSLFSTNLDKKNEVFESFYKNIISKFTDSLEIPSIPQYVIDLELKKFSEKKLSKRQIVNSLRYYGLKPMHLEISYKLMKILLLYSPQRIYYPFYIDMDILKRHK